MRIFISYRREDTSGYAGRLYDRLTAQFGPASVFMDIDAIGPGQNFVEAIEGAVGDSDVLIALIGQEWLTVQDESGARRLDNPDDFVRLEIAAALERGILVIPALVEHAGVPSPDELSEPLKPLSLRNALELSDSRFHQDADRLIAALEEHGANLAIAEASVEPLAGDEELGSRLEKLYTQGLSAFWMKDWDRAVESFRAVAEVRPDYEEVAPRLKEAERRAGADRLFKEAQSAFEAQDWAEAAAAFQSLLELDPEYEGAADKLEKARSKQQINTLYSEAQRLSSAREWQAVLSIFAQIKELDPGFVDPEALEAAASRQAEVEEKRAHLETLYGNAVRMLAAGDSGEAGDLLLELKRLEPGYRDTESLLESLGIEVAAGEPAAAQPRGIDRSSAAPEKAREPDSGAKPRRAASSLWAGLLSSGGLVAAALLCGVPLCAIVLLSLRPSTEPRPTSLAANPTDTHAPLTETPKPPVPTTPPAQLTAKAQSAQLTAQVESALTTAQAESALATAQAESALATAQAASALETATVLPLLSYLKARGFALSQGGQIEWMLFSHLVEYDKANGWAVVPLTTTSAENFVVKADIAWDSNSSSASCGFVFHVGNGSDSAGFSRDGTYWLSYRVGEDYESLSGNVSTLKLADGEVNTILIAVTGPTAKLYVNDRLVEEGNNATKRAGYVAPAAFGNISCVFDNGLLWLDP